MIIKWLIANEWRQVKRSSMRVQSKGIKIFLGIIFFLLFLEILAVSIFLSLGFEEGFPDDDPVEKFNSFVLYGLALGFVVRFFLQKVPVLSITPYLHLPIRRKQLVRYVLAKSLWSFYNFIPIIIFTPFVLFQIAPFYSVGAVAAYCVAIALSVLANNYLCLLFKRNLAGRAVIVLVIFVALAALGAAEYFGLISLSNFSTLYFTSILLHPLYVVVPAIILLLALWFNHRDLTYHLYPEDNRRLRRSFAEGWDVTRLVRGKSYIATLITLELRLLMRNKRSRSMLFLIPLMLLYGLLFYPDANKIDAKGWLLFVGIFTTGGFILFYGQYMFSWESSFFDGILTHVQDFEKYLRAKYQLMLYVSLAAFVLTLPYGFFSVNIIFINLAALFFNVGVSAFMVMLLSTNNRKRLDITQGASFNYQGVSATQFLISAPVILLPMLLYWLFSFLGYPFTGIVVVGTIGAIGILLHKRLLAIVTRRFTRKRHTMAEGFRYKG